MPKIIKWPGSSKGCHPGVQELSNVLATCFGQREEGDPLPPGAGDLIVDWFRDVDFTLAVLRTGAQRRRVADVHRDMSLACHDQTVLPDGTLVLPKDARVTIVRGNMPPQKDILTAGMLEERARNHERPDGA